MTAPELSKFMEELDRWCSEQRGRQAQVANALGVPRQVINDWISLRKRPGLDNYFALQAFLAKQRRARR